MNHTATNSLSLEELLGQPRRWFHYADPDNLDRSLCGDDRKGKPLFYPDQEQAICPDCIRIWADRRRAS